MRKFVGTWRGLRKELREVMSAWVYQWRERRQVWSAAEHGYREVAVWGIVDYDGEKDTWTYKGPGPQPTEFGMWLGARAEWLWSFVMYTYTWIPCWAFGHNIVDDSWAGPDSGGMAGHCSRCGWSYSHTLY